MNALRRVLGTHTDLALVGLVMGVLAVLFAPIPAGLLDFLILTNVGFAFLLLLLTFYVPRPVDFSTFPSLLLVATLFRLALNVAATRLILTSGDAGRVISAIGSYVVGGNYVIGLIVFLILIVVQYVVVTNGAQRVSEVAARFTLDSMPGQQMSIDADLNMGFIDQEEAQRRRRNLEREAGFYGSMDGASKFVKGDAIAGIVILLINIVGGLSIGMMQRGMRWDQALETYTLLTIGDGIVTQVPALVIAVGTGIIVTRSSSDTNLSREVVRQLTSAPRTLLIVACALAGLVLLPGIPVVPALTVASVAGLVAWFVYLRPPQANTEPVDRAGGKPTASDDPYAALAVEPIEVLVGRDWAPLVGDADSIFMERVSAFRTQQAEELGIVLPRVRFKESARLAPQRYEILIDGAVSGRGDIRLDRILAIHPAGDQRSIEGEATREPTYGLPALWIDPALRDEAVAARYTLVDPATVLITHLTEVLRREASTLLTRAETDRLLARVRKSQPGLVEEIVPTVLSVSDVQKVLQGLLREKISIRNIDAVMETLADAGRATRDATVLVESVRQRLGHAICQSLVGDAGALHVLTLDPSLEGRLLSSIRGGADRPPAPIDPGLADQMVAALAKQAERMMKNNLLPVLLCAPELRRHVRALSERAMPHLRVLSVNEVPQTIELRAWGVVGN
jgi:flagellar biosynthesis protein FlhA